MTKALTDAFEDILRSQILYKATINPENYDEPKRKLYERVLELQRRYEVIEATRWTFSELDAQERRQVNEYLDYRQVKLRLEEEASNRKK